jgi:M6 family metalloprotease-like protein
VSGEGKLDLVFMGDGVSDDTVASAASRFGAALYSFAPYSQYKDRIAIHTITEKPSCSNTSVDSNAGPYTSVSCQTAQAATASGVPTDKVVVVSSSVSREHANRGSSMSISPSTSTSTFLHEMGHVMGLADEYHGYEDGSWGEQSLTAYGQCITATGSTDTKMFFNGDWKSASGPWSAWAGLGGVDWHRECSDTRWLRPSADSIMRSGFGAYNSVSEFIVKNELERHMTGVESTLPGYGNTGSGGGVFSR